MARFIELTVSGQSRKIWVNMDYIVTMERAAESTTLKMSDGSHEGVTDIPETIAAQAARG